MNNPCRESLESTSLNNGDDYKPYHLSAISRRTALVALALPGGIAPLFALPGSVPSWLGEPNTSLGDGNRVTRGFASVKDASFAGGAMGNGKSDDTRAIQAAIDSGREVFLPAGTYRLTAQLTVPSRCRIYGTGNSSILKKDNEKINRLIVNENHDRGNEDIVIENIAVDGSRTSSTFASLTDGIVLTRCRNSSIRDVVVRHCLNNGIIIEYGVGNTVSRCNLVGNAKNGIYVSGSQSVLLENNFSYNNLLGGIAVAATRSGIVRNNKCNCNRVDVLLGRNSLFVDVCNNICQSDTAFAISPETITGQVLNGVTYPKKPALGWDWVYGASSCSIRKNYFGGQVRLILLKSSEFSENACFHSTAQGIVLQGASYNRIVANTVRDWNDRFGGIQIAPLLESDKIPISQRPPIHSVGNILENNYIYPDKRARVLVNDGVKTETSNNLVF